MYFPTWIAKQPRGTVARLMRESGLSLRTFTNLGAGRPVQYGSAMALIAVTGRVFNVHDLCDPESCKRKDGGK